MLGLSTVGKSSLVARFVRSIFSEKYQATLGVKIDKKIITFAGQDLSLLLWDISTDAEFQRVRAIYLRGTAGYILVVDGTRPETLEGALLLHQETEKLIGKIPCILVLNKYDLTEQWQVTTPQITQLQTQGWTVIFSSAKTGEGVEEAFLALAQQILVNGSA